MEDLILRCPNLEVLELRGCVEYHHLKIGSKMLKRLVLEVGDFYDAGSGVNVSMAAGLSSWCSRMLRPSLSFGLMLCTYWKAIIIGARLLGYSNKCLILSILACKIGGLSRPVNGSGLLDFGSGLIRPVKLTGHPNPTR